MFDYSQVTPRQQEIADAVAQNTGVFFVNRANEYSLICAVEKALPEGEEEVARAFYAHCDLLHARENAQAVIKALAMEAQR